MKLADLAFACYVYSHMTDYDGSYRDLIKKTSPRVDLNNTSHCMDLIKWLNSWGCRQFAIDHHNMAAGEIKSWYRDIADLLFPEDKNLLSLSEIDFKVVNKAYSTLCSKIASIRTLRNGKVTNVVVGPTGAAKILFAIRPNALIPWDDLIRNEFDMDGDGRSYVEYLLKAKTQLEELREECEKNDFELAGLPLKLNRPESSVSKLIDEYYWVTVSRGCPPPSGNELKRWISWA